ncbi:PqiC family protein [Erwinia billingiae]|uniref:PqiC family protein n=1 Tax=Erwinia billingiae TaxID=182337 RepID=UPI00069E0D4C|nr:PqiC family protein [Erwinia billingiae]
MRYLLPAICLLLAACTSPDIHYHTLMSSTPSTVHRIQFDINVLPVIVPSQLDMQQVVIRENSSSAAILENQRWLSPLADEFTTALSAQLAERLATQDIAGLANQPNRPVVSVKVKVRRFDSWPGNKIHLQADWLLTLKPENRQTLCHSDLSQVVGGDVSALFPAWQNLLNRLSEQIAAAALTLSKQTASCRAQGNL